MRDYPSVTDHTPALIGKFPTIDHWFAAIWRAQWDDPPMVALLWVKPDDNGRQRITRAVLDGPGLTVEGLRQLPLSRIETIITARTAEQPEAHEDNSLTAAIDAELTIVRSNLPSPDEAASVYAPRLTERPRLTSPQAPGALRGDDFYKLVATAYLEAVASTRAVAPLIADEAGVPVGTARRWILEARRRGFLPDAGRSRA